MLLHNLWRRRTRTLLTLLGVAVGIAAIVVLVALARGVVASYVDVTNRSGADITIQAVQGQGQAITLGTGFDEAVLDRLRAMPEVKSASGMLYTIVPVPGVPFFIVFAYELDQAGIRHFKVIEGAPLAERPSHGGGKPILLGKMAADSLHKRVGDTITLHQTTFRVVGIYATGVSMEDGAGVISLRDGQALTNMPRQVIYVGAQLVHPERAEEFKARLAKALPRDVEIAGTQTGNTMLEMLELLNAFAWAVALIAALIGGVGMMNTMLMSVHERTREIGVLRAIGWSRGRALGLILGESLALSVAGGVLGLGVGAALTFAAAHTPALSSMTKGTVPGGLVVQALSAAVVLGMVGGVYPAWRASCLAPVEALSYDGGAARRQRGAIPWGGMALKNLSRQRTRTILTLVGVGIGVLGMLLMGSLNEGMVKSFNGMLIGAEVTAVQGGQADMSLSVIDEHTLKRIEAMPGIHYVAGIIISFVSTPENAMLAITARERTDPVLNRRILKEGHLLDGRRQCLLGWKAASEQRKKLGDRLSFLGATFRIVGIVETGSSYEDGGVIIDLHEAQQLLKKPHQVMAMQIKLVDASQTDSLLSDLTRQYPKLLFSKSAEFTENLPDMKNMRLSFLAIFMLTLVVGSIALMNTMVMSVSERTREIGVLRAVGWRRGMVLRLMLGEALLLTLLSGLVGVVWTALVVCVIKAIPALGIWRDMFELTPTVIIEALLLCVTLGVIGGLYPSWRATRLSPVEALRYE
jgi:ABC-type antimicrobial peptide transport system permease subunit